MPEKTWRGWRLKVHLKKSSLNVPHFYTKSLKTRLMPFQKSCFKNHLLKPVKLLRYKNLFMTDIEKNHQIITGTGKNSISQ